MSNSRQTILIIGGGWHTPSSYEKLKVALEANGHEVKVVNHPSMNEARPPTADLYSDTDNVRSYVESLLKDDREIIVLMHSYGGQVGTNALHDFSTKQRSSKGLVGGISNLIYMAACAVSEGKSMLDMVRHHGHEKLMPLAFDFADDKTCLCKDPKLQLVGTDSGLSEREIDDYLATLVRWNGGNCMYQNQDTPRSAWRDIPVSYIFTTQDMTLPYDYQKWLVDEMKKQGVEVQTTSITTGHCPNLTATDKVVSAVSKVARGEALDVGDVGQETNNDIAKATIESIH